jgi:hypothetical protein
VTSDELFLRNRHQGVIEVTVGLKHLSKGGRDLLELITGDDKLLDTLSDLCSHDTTGTVDRLDEGVMAKLVWAVQDHVDDVTIKPSIHGVEGVYKLVPKILRCRCWLNVSGLIILYLTWYPTGRLCEAASEVGSDLLHLECHRENLPRHDLMVAVVGAKGGDQMCELWFRTLRQLVYEI